MIGSLCSGQVTAIWMMSNGVHRIYQTPRASDVNGLSAFRDVPSPPNCKYQVIDISKLYHLHTFCDNTVTGHFCIVPHDMSRMQEWIDSRGRTIHEFTEELQNAIVAQHKT